MLDYKTQSQLVDATATIMLAYFNAATSTAAASAGRSWSLWSEMVESGKQGEFRLPQAWWLRTGTWAAIADRGTGPVAPMNAAAAGSPQANPAYAAYRSAGGHAAVQVIAPAVEQLAEAGAAIALAPMRTMLGVWRLARRH